MAKTAGRDCVIKIGGTAVAGARVDGITFNNTPIDVTDKSDGEFVKYLGDAFASRTLEMSCEGVEDGQVLRDKAASLDPADLHFSDVTFEFANGDVIAGATIMTNYQEGAPYQDSQTFSCSFVMNGQWTWMPAV